MANTKANGNAPQGGATATEKPNSEINQDVNTQVSNETADVSEQPIEAAQDYSAKLEAENELLALTEKQIKVIEDAKLPLFPGLAEQRDAIKKRIAGLEVQQRNSAIIERMNRYADEIYAELPAGEFNLWFVIKIDQSGKKTAVMKYGKSELAAPRAAGEDTGHKVGQKVEITRNDGSLHTYDSGAKAAEAHGLKHGYGVNALRELESAVKKGVIKAWKRAA